MSAFRAILLWEIRRALLRVSTWVFFVVYLLLAFGAMLVAGGAFDSLFGGGGNRNAIANSPQTLAELISFFTLMGLSITAALAGNALYRDYDAGIDPLLYTTPISKRQFLGGRISGALVVNLLIMASVGLGAAMAASSPLVKAHKVVPFDVAAYVEPYTLFVLPNLVLTIAIFFALVTVTRQMLPVYVGGVLLLIGYLVSSALLDNLDNKRLAALVDPFGLNALDLVTQYWSVAEKNARHIPLESILVWNRVLWLGVGFVILAFAYRRFRFSHAANERRGSGAISDAGAGEMTDLVRGVEPARLPAVVPRFDLRAHLVQLAAITRQSFVGIVRNRYFAAIVVGALVFLAVGAWQAGRLYGTPTWPVTYQVEEILTGTMGLILLVIIAVYSGELIWGDRDLKSNQIVDATPVPTSVLFLGKVLALAAMIVLIMLVLIVAGVVTQTVKGYYRFEIPIYLQALLGVRLLSFVMLVPFAMAVHVVVNHKYVGHLVVILALLGMGLLTLIGLDRNFYRYGADSGIVYSDMNGWGVFLRPYLWWKAYWVAFASLLLLATNLLWVRGGETSARTRLRLAGRRFGRSARVIATVAGTSFAGLGALLYYNTDVLNIHRSGRENRRLLAQREKQYKRFEQSPQPRIVAMTLRVDLEPRRQAVRIAGEYVLRNKTAAPIDSVHLTIAEEMAIRALTFGGGARHVRADSVRDYHIYRLTRPLQPGDSTTMRFELAYRARGIPQRVTNTALVDNGSFLSSGLFLPSIGYSADRELSDEGDREKEKLPPKERMRPPTDPATLANNYVSNDADWVRFDATVSTDEDQIAIAPGYLQREWVENGRRVFHYTMDAPILNLWAVLSGRYAVKRDRWRDVDIAIYYHPAHTYNVDRMIASVKKSLDYFTEQFGPYQHRQVRIIEFPRYASFAQSLPNMIPYSEGIGFIARIEKQDDVDYPFYITAHELAHAWWAHQVVGADAQGATMLSETLAQYSALMVMEKEFGQRNMRRFLAYELHNYLLQRGLEFRREMPLQLVENQPSIHYNKGSLVMYALRDYIGESRVNGVLRQFLADKKFRGPPYPTSLELVAALRTATPDSLKYLITDLFETITLYELKTDSAIVSDVPGRGAPGTFQVDLWVSARKLRADSLGRETAIAMRDWIDLGVYAKPAAGARSPDVNGIPIYLAKQRVDSGRGHFTITVDRRPSRAGIDPMHKLIDRMTRDNVVDVRDRRPAAGAQRDTTSRR